MNPLQQKQPGSSGQKTFWTACPFCKVRYLYYIEMMNRSILCQKCKQPFLAYDADPQGTPLGANNWPCSPKKEGWELGPDGSSSVEEILPNEYAKSKQCKKNEQEAATADEDREAPEAANEVQSNIVLENKPYRNIIEVPEPDFHDFDRDKREVCFADDQMWAVYDDVDGMPRYYARIKNVYSPGFKVKITWLEPCPDDQNGIIWSIAKLPISCGKFKNENTEETEDIGIFSHRVEWEKGPTRSCCWIYPRKGETWALFKNWDIKWSVEPDNHRNYDYEFVEILSDYTKELGVNVVYLVKISGFVSLFKPNKNNGMASFHIPHDELLRFSHQVPSFRMTGTEREDVPEGSFELDPASLPVNIVKTSNPVNMKLNVETNDAKIDASSKSSAEKKPFKQKKRSNPEEQNTMDGGNSKSGNRSPRIAKLCSKKIQIEETSGNPFYKNTSISRSEKNCDTSTFGQKSAFTCQAAGDANVMGRYGDDTVPGSMDEKIPSSPAHLEITEIPEADFCNFEDYRSYEKFKPGQLWALYCSFDDLPKYYAQIQSVELNPIFKLHIKWLESCNPPKGVILWLDRKMPICSGTFRVTCGENVVFNGNEYFSHQLSGIPAGSNVFTIYPKEGEVWALYRNFSTDLTCSDLKKCEYYMVEILEVFHVSWIIVLVLQKVTGFKTVFQAKRKGGHDFIMGIPWIELFRFSHQVPAFKLTEARYGNLRGCWELDPKSVPVYFFSSN